MIFKLNVNVSEQEYIDFNMFVIKNTAQGKKTIKIFTVSFVILGLLASWLKMFGGGYTKESIIEAIPYFVIMMGLAVAYPLCVKLVVKRSVKLMRKTGKMLFPQSSVMEFYEESFKEIAAEQTTQQKYSGIDKISIVTGKVIYIHANHLVAYVIPLASFESEEQYKSFVEFLKTKCANILVY